MLLLINKIDLRNEEELVKLVEGWEEEVGEGEIIGIWGSCKLNVDRVMKGMKELVGD